MKAQLAWILMVLPLVGCAAAEVEEVSSRGQNGTADPFVTIKASGTMDGGLALARAIEIDVVAARCSDDNDTEYSADLSAGEELKIPRLKVDCIVYPKTVNYRDTDFAISPAPNSYASISDFHNRGSSPASRVVLPTTADPSVDSGKMFAVDQLAAGVVGQLEDLEVEFRFTFSATEDVLDGTDASFARNTVLSVTASGEGFPEYSTSASSLVASNFPGDDFPGEDSCPMEVTFTCEAEDSSTGAPSITSCEDLALANTKVILSYKNPDTSSTGVTLLNTVLSDSAAVRVDRNAVTVRLPLTCGRDSGTAASETVAIEVSLQASVALSAGESALSSRVYSWKTTLNFGN